MCVLRVNRFPKPRNGLQEYKFKQQKQGLIYRE